MRKIALTIVANLVFISMLAQVEINLRDARNLSLDDRTESTYFKDTFNDLDKFVGEWTLEIGNKKLEVSIQKLIRVPETRMLRIDDGLQHYQDLISVNYKLYENNQLIINYNSSDYQFLTIQSNDFVDYRIPNGPRTSNILNHIFLSYYEPTSDGSCLRSIATNLQLTYQDVPSTDSQGNTTTGELFWRIESERQIAFNNGCDDGNTSDTGPLRNLSEVTLIRD